jgi:hypothetical protein
MYRPSSLSFPNKVSPAYDDSALWMAFVWLKNRIIWLANDLLVRPFSVRWTHDGAENGCEAVVCIR